MEREVVVSKVLRDMKMLEIISEEKSGESRIFLNAIYVAAQEQKTKELLAHNKRKVLQYDRAGQLIGTFDSIIEAAAENECNRDVIDDSISQRANFTRKGHYFRYADENTR